METCIHCGKEITIPRQSIAAVANKQFLLGLVCGAFLASSIAAVLVSVWNGEEKTEQQPMPQAAASQKRQNQTSMTQPSESPYKTATDFALSKYPNAFSSKGWPRDNILTRLRKGLPVIAPYHEDRRFMLSWIEKIPKQTRNEYATKCLDLATAALLGTLRPTTPEYIEKVRRRELSTVGAGLNELNITSSINYLTPSSFNPSRDNLCEMAFNVAASMSIKSRAAEVNIATQKSTLDRVFSNAVVHYTEEKIKGRNPIPPSRKNPARLRDWRVWCIKCGVLWPDDHKTPEHARTCPYAKEIDRF